MVKILIVRLGALGDILHALPAVTAIRAALPEAHIGWVVEESWLELLSTREAAASHELSAQKPVVNRIHAVNTKRWRKVMLHPSTTAEIKAVFSEIRGCGYDLAIDFQGAIKSALCAAFGKPKRIAGFADPREWSAHFFYSQKVPRAGEHVIEQNLALASSALTQHSDGSELPLTAPPLPRDCAAEAWADAEIQRLGIASFAVINPGAGWGAKQWPAERFGEVAKALARHNLKTLVNAGPSEEGMAEAVVRASGGNAFPLRCSIGQLIAIMRRARLAIAGDTGPLHLAAALGVRTVGLYGPTDPARTGPFGAPGVVLRHPESQTTSSHHRHPEDGLLKITTEEVIAAARRLLGSS
ncbi:MAG TPA: lipopolysaccharide heptosyltransferase I [Candidatus Angelobacter sp.]|nr:lipopolysaccharide heptosyltransferase I [Candidatus Angelobacter sp.]